MKEFSQRYAEALDRQDDAAMLSRARARFAEKLHGVDTPAPSRWRFVVPVVSAVAAAALVAFAVWPEEPLSVSVRGQPDNAGHFVQAKAGDEVLDFSDGTEVVIRDESELRVSQVTAHGADVVLERGAAHVAVVHRDKKTRWNFSAGPYRVAVVGTKFELRWDPETKALEVEMDEGIVEVDGPGLTRQRVTSKQKLEAFPSPPRASLYLETPPAQGESEETAESTPPTVRVVRDRRPEKAEKIEKPKAQGASWRYLADTGDSVGAMRAAEEAGFSWLVRSMPKSDVLLLGDTARKAKQIAHAREAWLTVRERFPGSDSATRAAIRLGDLAASVEHDDSTAARWFSTAANEAPYADTAPEAMGRWMEVLLHAKNMGEARRVAADYLKRFPNGPDVATARRLAH